MTYPVGVHYWHGHGFGLAVPTVRIYVFGVLVFKKKGPELVENDLWEVATVAWPSAQIEVLDTLTPGVKLVY